MKLYQLVRGSSFRIFDEYPVRVYKFARVDGMYSICYDMGGNVVHIAAYTDVENVTK